MKKAAAVVGLVAWAALRGGAAFADAPIYSFSKDAEELFELMFPRRLTSRTVGNAVVEKDDPRAFKNLDDVLLHYDKALRPSAAPPSPLDLDQDHLESRWLSIRPDNGLAEELLQEGKCEKIRCIAESLARGKRRFPTVLEKALFQRDVFQMCAVYDAALGAVSGKAAKRRAERTLAALGRLLKTLRLSNEDYESLRKLRPKEIDARRFRLANRFDPADDYLPARVLRDEAGWYEMPYRGEHSKHFKDFGGRSFIRVFIRPPGMTQEEFQSYWDRVFAQFGEDAPVASGVPPLPAKTETLLLRTFAVLLEDGSVADSGFPEEVLMRLIKLKEQRLDPSTSDYRGVLQYQYKMRRRALLADPASLGLVRRADDSISFFGFFAETPDLSNSYDQDVTTTRYNCIGCHSLQLYGGSTVFSLATKRPKSTDSIEGGLLQATGKPGRYVLATDEYKALVKFFQEHAIN